jgi:hypothetical protein
VSGEKLPEKPIFIDIKCSHPDVWEDREIKQDVQSDDGTVKQPDVGRIGKNKTLFMPTMSQKRTQRCAHAE